MPLPLILLAAFIAGFALTTVYGYLLARDMAGTVAASINDAIRQAERPGEFVDTGRVE